MTANVLDEQIKSFYAAGVTAHVAKPFRRADLEAVLERMRETTGRAASTDDTIPLLRVASLQELAHMIGEPAVASLLDKFATDLRGRFVSLASATPDRARLADDAHAMVSSAGFLGFTRFSEACGRLERACRSNQDLSGLISSFDALRRATLAAAAHAAIPACRMA
jgi:HPt (histidine-containing phosphotransfer) domain-containing protein